MKNKKPLIIKILLAIPLFLLYILYVLLTMESRNKYLAGEAKGYHCERIDTGIIYDTAYYNPNRKPEREYATWKEFWQKFGY